MFASVRWILACELAVAAALGTFVALAESGPPLRTQAATGGFAFGFWVIAGVSAASVVACHLLLFTDDTVFAVYMDGGGTEPTYVLEGREALTPVFDDFNRYEVTTHFNGQSTVTLDGDRATGESYTIAHHVNTEDGERRIMVASLRYLDSFTKLDGRWYFAERKLILDWSETRSVTASATV